MPTEQHVKGEEIQEQTRDAQKTHDDEGHAGGLRSLRFDFEALRRGVQLGSAAFAVVGLLCVLESAGRAEHVASILTGYFYLPAICRVVCSTTLGGSTPCRTGSVGAPRQAGAASCTEFL